MDSIMMVECPLCKENTAEITSRNDCWTLYNCKICGRFKIDEDVVDFNYWNEWSIKKNPNDPKNKTIEKFRNERHLLSGLSRELTEAGFAPLHISEKSIISLLNDSRIARTLEEKIDKFLYYLSKKTTYFEEKIEFDESNDRSLMYAKNSQEMESILNLLVEEKSIYSWDNMNSIIHLTKDGLIYIQDKNINITTNSKQVFVAMWFSEEMEAIYNDSISPAIKECGFQAIKINEIEHNDDVTDAIISHIKSSRFMIADFTGLRSGVYYEAGYAKGLGLDVIFCCKKSWFEQGYKRISSDNVESQETGIHFDTNHQNFIVWEDGDDLKKRLIDRIRATI